MTGRLVTDDRGAALSYHIAALFGLLALGAFIGMVFQPAAEPMLDAAAGHTETQAAADGQQYVHYAWESLHIIVIAIGVLQFLVAAVFSSEVRR